MARKKISAEEFDRLFDEGSDEIDAYIDWDKMTRPGLEPEKIDVEVPRWIASGLALEAKRQGVSRQDLIKMWLGERLDRAA